MLEQKLKEIGLTEKEVAVYLCILQYQRILPARVATLTSINRPTIYSVAKELVKKGLITEDVAGPTRYFVSLGENALINIAKEQEKKYIEMKGSIPLLVQELKQLPKQGKYSIPKIRFVDESGLRDFLINESSKWAEAAMKKDNTWWGFQDHTLLEHYQDWADHFWTKFSKSISLNLFTNKKPVETGLMSKKSYSPQRHIKFLEENSEFTATHVVVGDYILMIMTREHPHYLIEIHDRVIAENIRQLFKNMWKSH
jgi:sugar-specific transcriptional regulator TrmB